MIELAALAAVALVILVLIIWVGRQTSGLDRHYYQKRWAAIEQVFQTGESGPRVAVIDGDALLDRALKDRRFAGESMGERLRSAEGSLSSYNKVWQAHKLRNQLVHESGKQLRHNEASFAIHTYKKALKELGAL